MHKEERRLLPFREYWANTSTPFPIARLWQSATTTKPIAIYRTPRYEVGEQLNRCKTMVFHIVNDKCLADGPNREPVVAVVVVPVVFVRIEVEVAGVVAVGRVERTRPVVAPAASIVELGTETVAGGTMSTSFSPAGLASAPSGEYLGRLVTGKPTKQKLSSPPFSALRVTFICGLTCFTQSHALRS